MLGASEVAFILYHSGSSAFAVEDGLLSVGHGAFEHGGDSVTACRLIRLTDTAVPAGWVDASRTRGSNRPRATLVGRASRA